MCEPATIAALATVVSAGAAAKTAFASPPKVPKPPKVAVDAPVTPKPKPSTSGYSSTLLTGSKGLLAGSQNVGTNTLLGQ